MLRRSADGRWTTGSAAILVLAALLVSAPVAAQEQVLLDEGSPLVYLPNDIDPGIPGTAWVDPSFDDSGWVAGTYGIGYETLPPGATGLIQTAVAGPLDSLYTRATFTIDDPSTVENLYLGLDFDDGVVVWINGDEAYRSPSMPAGTPEWDSRADSHESSNGDAPDFELTDLSAAIGSLVAGQNVIAIGVWNQSGGSSDMVVVPWLAINTPLQLTRAPYLQAAGHDRIVVHWRTNVPSDSRVDFGLASDTLVETVADPTPVVDHEVVLTDLDPQTRYYYQIGTATDTLAGGDNDHTFLTAPLPGTPAPTRVWVLGDSGTANSSAAAVRDAYVAATGGTHTDLWLMLGDNAYPDGTDDEFQAAVFDMYPDMLRGSPLFPAIGNHEYPTSNSLYQTGPYYEIFTMPTSGELGGVSSGTEAYYSFDWANIHFVVLDSHGSDRSPDGPMMTWLAEDLAATAQDWVIAYWHHPPYSKGSHDSDIEQRLVDMRENALPILDDYGVDLTLTGHSHSYERSYLIEGHYGDSTTLAPGMIVDGGDGRVDGDGPYRKDDPGTAPHTGTVHAVAGSSGRITGGDLDHPVMFVSFNVLGSMILEIDGGRLDGSFLSSTGEVLDWFTITKGDVTVPPVADFAIAPASGSAPLLVDFIDESRNFPTTWSWDFDDDGVEDSADQNPQHTYSAPGIYDVRLNVANSEGSDEMMLERAVCVTLATVPLIDDLIFPGPDMLTWSPVAAAVDYDLVRGDLGTLRSTGGDFTAAQDACVAENVPDPQAIDADVPPSGTAWFYLTRAADCAARTGSFDAPGLGLVAGRDLELQAGGSCSCDTLDDYDGDGFCNGFDACTDLDGDGLGDPGFAANTCDPDNCPDVANASQTDADLDGSGDACDACTDLDADGFGDPGFAANTCPLDNCPATPNADQFDADVDGVGDICDSCTDLDADGFGDPGFPANACELDNCPAIANAEQTDSDADLAGDACDPCAFDPDDDADTDGLCADVDNCPSVANAGQDDLDLDGVGDVCDTCTDPDQDSFGSPGFPANVCQLDNCPDDFNFGQEDADADTLGDACDSCPFDAQNDIDTDGVCGDVDVCPTVADPDQADTDSDSLGDACDPCTDPDHDGFGNPDLPATTCPVDNCPFKTNPDQSDQDADAIGDRCDTCPFDPGNDADTDGLCGDVDNCPETANAGQEDGDLDEIGDVCDACPVDPANDIDGDGVCGDVDNCPVDFDPAQLDTDADGAGDACDPDDDSDGVEDVSDCRPLMRGVAAPPEPIGPTLRIEPTAGGMLHWLRSAQGHLANVYRGTRNDGAGFTYNAQCLSEERTGTQLLDGATPPSGSLYFYLVAARNVCGESQAGEMPGGSPYFPPLACPFTFADTDGDGIADGADNCAQMANVEQADTDADFVGDDCDNCPVKFNPDQADVDGNGIGDACD